MQTAKIDNLLDLINSGNKKPKAKAADFLFQLLSNINDQDSIKELILKSNLSQKEKSELLKKFSSLKTNLPKISDTKTPVFILDTKQVKIKNPDLNQNSILKITSTKKFFHSLIIEKKTLPQKSIKTVSEDKDIIKKLLNSNTDFSKKNIEEIELAISNLPKPIQNEIVTEIKHIIKSKANQNKTIQTLINLKEFKNASNIKDITTITKKFGLNLKKIVFSQNNTEKPVSNETPLSSVKINPEIRHSIKNISKKPLLRTKSTQSTLTKLINTQTEKSSKENIFPTDKKETKTVKKENNQDITQLIHPNEIKHKAIEAKQSLKHFASSLKEAVENYKPPVSKLTLELHPKEIGKVEVVIRQRGENLQVQISTNNQTTINFLTSQQQELKNNLVNMGFSNINMNFNSNDQNKKQNQHQKQNNYQKIQNDENEELVIDFSYQYA